jgi:hypothetical protein
MPVRGPLRRISAQDVIAAESIFQAAVLLLTPEKTGARVFLEQATLVRELRDQGASWKQIQDVLKAINVNLKVSTLRSYQSRSRSKKTKKP